MSSQFAIPSLSWSCKTYISGLHAYRLAMLVSARIKYNPLASLGKVQFYFCVSYNDVFCYKYFLRDCLYIFSGLVVYTTKPLLTCCQGTTQLQCQLDQRMHLPLNHSASDGRAGRGPGNEAIFRV